MLPSPFMGLCPNQATINKGIKVPLSKIERLHIISSYGNI
ncbi:hypothetical protein GMES_0984 [Paraglaciecola mesophila KMM 241]|uniref:Uncharacterized protein n=1 Tax=Paraglaciecola mesophila KMM 241 TaxID=1128912 RepID=K6Z2T5_9ALTE|nr:hypothetical protein GMES_0984 [Paraglaciecola mesophila KMM 241]